MAIELREIWFRYRKEDRPVLRGISLVFREGITALIGPNGAGKSTLLKIAATIYRPERGEIYVDGVDVWSLSDEERIEVRRSILYIHEHPVMLRRSVWENVAYTLKVRGVGEEELRKEVRKALRVMGIEELRDAWAPALSAGQRQRVALARAVVANPRYLLLDEPTANLDSKSREFFEKIVKTLAAEGVTIITATHDRLIAARFSDRVILMENGEVAAEGSPQEIVKL